MPHSSLEDDSGDFSLRLETLVPGHGGQATEITQLTDTIIPGSFHTPCAECYDYSIHVQDRHPEDHLSSNMRSSVAAVIFSEGVETGRHSQLEEDAALLSRYRSRLSSLRRKYEGAVLIHQRYRDEAETLRLQLQETRDRLLAVQLAYDDLAFSNTRTESVANIPDLPTPPSPEIYAAVHPHVSNSNDDDFSSLSSSSSEDSSFFWDSEQDFDVIQQLHWMEEFDKEDRERLAKQDAFVLKSPLVAAPSDVLNALDSGAINASSLAPVPIEEDQSWNTIRIPTLSTFISMAHKGDIPARKRIRTLIKAAEGIPRKSRTAEQLFLLRTWRKSSGSSSSNSSTDSLISVESLPYIPPSSTSATSKIPEIFVDASGYGIGFIFDNSWLAWKFTPNHPLIPRGPDDRLIMSWGELVAVELGIRTLLAAGFRDTTVRLRSDNSGVVTALEQGKWISKWGLDDILEGIRNLCEQARLTLKVKWVSTKVNPADNPSRGVYPSRDLMFQHRPVIPLHLEGMVQDVHVM